MSRARNTHSTSESRYSSKLFPLGCREAYGWMASRGVPPRSCHVGLPAALPLISQRAISMAPMALMTAPRRPFMQLPT